MQLPFTKNLFLFILICVPWWSLLLSTIFIEKFSRIRNFEDCAPSQEADINDLLFDQQITKQKLRYILIWNPLLWDPLYRIGPGQQGFIRKNCPESSCYLTGDRNHFKGDVSKFDAIIFNGRNIYKIPKLSLPESRSASQVYIYFNRESSDIHPVCESVYDGWFNMTATYRLDSDIPFTYINIKNMNGDVVGPKENMIWTNDMKFDEKLSTHLQNKSKAAAWFVSNCKARSGRSSYVTQLQKELKKFKLTIDIFGDCGSIKCPKEDKETCNAKVKDEYFFYLSLENSLAKDYVTEKLLTALNNAAVPIVYGAANYSRFLPPTAYLNAFDLKLAELASRMHELISSPRLYQQYFKWWNYYTYSDPSNEEDICAICSALTNNNLINKTPDVYKNFRYWWNSNYANRCLYKS